VLQERVRMRSIAWDCGCRVTPITMPGYSKGVVTGRLVAVHA
jgi:hypothetical protein